MQGKRRQQGQKNTTKLKTICPSCNDSYLKSLWARFSIDKKLKWVKVGGFCPKCKYVKIDGSY